MKVELRDWIYVIHPGKKRGFYGWVFTIDDSHIHVWDPKRRMGHRIVSEKKDQIIIVCRNVRLKNDAPTYVTMYHDSRFNNYSSYQTLSERR